MVSFRKLCVKVGSRVDFKKVVEILGKCCYDISYIGLYREDDIYCVFIQTSSVNSKMLPEKIRKICEGFSDDILDVSPYKKVSDNGEVFKKWGGDRSSNPIIKLCINALGQEDVSHITPEVMVGTLKSYEFLREVMEENYGEENMNKIFNQKWSDYRKKCRKEIRDWDERNSNGENTLAKSLNLPERTYASGGEFVYEDYEIKYKTPEGSDDESKESVDESDESETKESDDSEESKESVEESKESVEDHEGSSEESYENTSSDDDSYDEPDEKFLKEMVKDYDKESFSYDLNSDSEENLEKKRVLLQERLSMLDIERYTGDFITRFEEILYENPHNVNVFSSTERSVFQYFNGQKWIKSNKRDYFEKIIVERIHKADAINKDFGRTESIPKTEGIRVHNILFSLLNTPVSGSLRREIVKDSIILSENRKRDLSLIKENSGRKIRKVRITSDLTLRNKYNTWEKLQDI